jgi:GNAT superfamily N-acetyltransferase
MISVRPATSEDAEELVRLRGLMFAAMDGWQSNPGPWEDHALDAFRARLGSEELAAFVVDAADGGLAACAVGVIDEHVAGPANPSGRSGHVFNVSTDPAYRRRGYSRACMQHLLDWYKMEKIAQVDLRASKEGEGLYTSLGFVRTEDPAMRLYLTVS